jgi:hypothetical protein
MSIISTGSRSPWRIQVVTSTAPSTTPGDYTITRVDAVATTITVTAAWILGGAAYAVELALSGAMLDGIAYQVAVAGIGGAVVGYRAPVQPGGTSATVSDPEASAFGIDLAWIGDSLDSRNDIPRRSGVACLKHDLPAASATQPGELIHRPDEGGGLYTATNGASSDLSRIADAQRRQWQSDRRIKSNGVTIIPTANADGTVDIRGTVTPIATGQPIDIQTGSQG